ncbi:DNA ligase 4-like [Ostrinia furnacalis]|uniref:DNA ligase 4-like n=1 Tax=Ostrinia furnacalis TaxID=93504 RepID=UPI00103FBDF8|nr:DNA ligase 4-like [Ostrinia furnacalis]
MDLALPGSSSMDMEIDINPEKDLTSKFLNGEMSFAEYSSEWYDVEDEEDIDDTSKPSDEDRLSPSAHFMEKGTLRRRKCTRLSPALMGLMGEANLRFVRGDKEMAEKMCHEIIKQVPTAPEPYQTLAQIYEHDAEKSLQFSLLAAHLRPSDANEWLRLANISNQKNDTRQEMLCYTQAVRADPHNLDIHLKRLEVLSILEDMKYPVHTMNVSRVKCYHKIVTSLPASEGEVIMKYAKMAATLYHNSNEVERSLEVMGAAYKKCSSLFTHEDLNILLELLILRKQYQTCLDIFVANVGVEIEAEIQTVKNSDNDAIEEHTNYLNCSIPENLHIDLKSKLLVCFIHLGSINLVQTLLQDFLSNDVEKAGDLYMDIEEALSSAGYHELAMKLLDPLVKNNSFDLGAVWLKHAECLHNLGREDDAIESYYKVLKHVPQHPDARRKLFTILEKKGKIDEALNILQQDYRYIVSASLLYEQCLALKKYNRLLKYLENTNLYPILRLLLPKYERERSPYNMKETKLAQLLVRVLSLSKQSPAAKRLINFRSVSNTQDSDFAGVAYYALKGILGKNKGDLTVEDINTILDKIATAEVGNKARVLNEAFGYAIRHLTPEQLKWFLRLILKDLKLGIETKRILAAFHPDAPEYFETCNSISKVCEELEDGDIRPLEMGVKMFYAISPMLSERLDVTEIHRQLFFDGTTYIVENKFDGERFQIHMENGIFEYFSRKGHKYSDNYGKTYESGLLTPFLKDCFNPEVESFIIDGEMMGWHKANHYYSSKGISFDVKKITVRSVFRPCFCAFDVLYYNGKALVGSAERGGVPLKERLEILDSMFTDVTGVIQHSRRETVKDSTDVLNKLNEAIENQDEGIVVKDVESYYLPSRRNAGWYKVKPEYTEGTMDDLDLVIIGADEAENKKQGRAKSFHVACLDVTGGADAPRWVSVGRVATGLSFDERERLCVALERRWVPAADAPPPPELDFNKEKPDFWVMPEHSTVLQVRATELIQSVGFGTDYTLRFPRVVKIRDDKPVRDVMTLEEFNALVSNKGPVVKLSSTQVRKESMGEGRSLRKRVAKTVKVADQFVTTPSSSVEVVSKALLGRKVCILSDDDDCKKLELRNIVESHGGTFVSNIGPDTWCAVVGRITRRENEIIKSQEVDVTTTAWLRSLPRSESPCILPPLETLAMKKATRLAMSNDYDCFGDSYTEPIDEATLRKCFEKMDRNEPQIYLTNREMLSLDRELFGASNPHSFLRACSLHVACRSGARASQAAMRGAARADVLSPALTHVVLPADAPRAEVARLKRKLTATIVSENWLEACFAAKALVPEDEFIL